MYYHKFSPRTISTYLSAIAYVHKLLHRSDPTASFLVKKVVAGAYRLAPSMDMRLPITVPILDRLIQAVVHTATTAYYRVLFQAMFLFAFNTFARVGEITMTGNNQNNLLLSDVQLEQPSSGLVINVFFSRFKHNPNNARHKISFGHGPTKSSAAKALHDYLLLRGSNSGPLFVIPGNTPVPRPLFDRQLHRCLAFCKLDSTCYKGHSFRIGAASYAAEQGYSDAKICSMGRWHSSAFRKYIRANSVM